MHTRYSKPGTDRLQGRDTTTSPTRLTHHLKVKISYLNSMLHYIEDDIEAERRPGSAVASTLNLILTLTAN